MATFSKLLARVVEILFGHHFRVARHPTNIRSRRPSLRFSPQEFWKHFRPARSNSPGTKIPSMTIRRKMRTHSGSPRPDFIGASSENFAMVRAEGLEPSWAV
jgi:hypothetical protein